MKNKFAIGALVRLKDDTKLVWKVVEVWDVAYVAAITNKINKSNRYVITNIPSGTAVVADEDNISAIEVKDEPEVKEKTPENK